MDSTILIRAICMYDLVVQTKFRNKLELAQQPSSSRKLSYQILQLQYL